ncbi:MAG: hypothetical protein WBA42_01735 [Mesorhizobium sp.]
MQPVRLANEIAKIVGRCTNTIQFPANVMPMPRGLCIIQFSAKVTREGVER